MLKLSSKMKLITNLLLTAQTVSIPSCKILYPMSIKYSNLSCWQLTSNSFDFTTQKQSTNKYGQKQSLSSVLKEYKIKADQLRIEQHFQYFLRVFRTKEQINQNALYWRILNSKLFQCINTLKYYQVIEILYCLSQVGIQNPLTAVAQAVSLQNIQFANIEGLARILSYLNHKKIIINAQEELKYHKVYKRLLQIIPIKIKNISQRSEISFEGPTIIIKKFNKQKKKQERQYNQSQNEIKIYRNNYVPLINQLRFVKVKNSELREYLLYNPLTNYNAKQHIQHVFYLTELKLIFIALDRHNNTNNHLRLSTMKNIMKEIMNRQKKSQQTLDFSKKNEFEFLKVFSYFIGDFNSNLKRFQQDDPSSKEENFKFLNDLNKYFQKRLKQLTNTNITNEKLKNIAQEIFSKAQKFYLKNQIEKSIASQKSQKQKVSQISSDRLLFKIQQFINMSQTDRNKYDQQSSIIWQQIWKRYPKFDLSRKRLVAITIYKAQAIFNIKIQVPKEIELVEIIQTKKENKNNKKSQNNEKYYQITEILQSLSQSGIQNPLTTEAQAVSLQHIQFVNIDGLTKILAHLNDKKIELSTQEEQKYNIVYQRLLEIISIKKKEFSQKGQISCQGTSIIIIPFNKQKQKQKRKYNQSQGEIKIRNNQYVRLIDSLRFAKIKNVDLIEYILDSVETFTYFK